MYLKVKVLDDMTYKVITRISGAHLVAQRHQRLPSTSLWAEQSVGLNG